MGPNNNIKPVRAVTFEYDEKAKQLHIVGSQSGMVLLAQYVNENDESVLPKVLAFLKNSPTI